ncbi:hypothetical protein WA026_011056 [Henosepilachna vigintioctopunctata]|uniref:Reverse transcriptase domain-containing protein n=1 Tax=Henosepilachna vigintioctopunctata TaxID=420089 RepID=A0AAW1U9F2_9CUCU
MRKFRNTVITFIDFKKAYDSVYRETLLKIMKFIERTLSGTTSKVKFMAKYQIPLKSNPACSRGRPSPILFDIVEEKIITESELHVKGIQTILLSSKPTELKPFSPEKNYMR